MVHQSRTLDVTNEIKKSAIVQDVYNYDLGRYPSVLLSLWLLFNLRALGLFELQKEEPCKKNPVTD